MHKSLFGLAAVIFAAGFFIRSLPTSQAQDFGPVVTGGEAPWLSFSGTVSSSSTLVAYTVPADRSFVLTGACMDSQQVDLRETDAAGNDTLKINGDTYAMHCIVSGGAGGLVGRGQARVAFGPGSQVRVANGHSGTRPYFLNGYLAAP